MAKRLQLRGGTTAQHSTFTGALREVTVDTDKDTLVVHDGSTAGGFPLAKSSELSSIDTDLLNDTTPQLGGNLDVNGNSIVSVSNGNISITPDGTGKVILDGLSHPTADGTNGQALKTDGAGNLSFGDVAVDLTAVDSNIVPDTTDTYDLGTASFVWRNIYTGDLHLSNEAKSEGNSVDGTKGNWTIQEGAEDLFIVNNKSGKKYKFKLEEI